ncbi:FAD-binding and (Fe-S)-binding domain-containing protein [Daejeonella lutea]|uniref:D-lactate dehydrogenase (cytochrome) n=1 Tax=Daejeonella lutea TaxID=572036 RepID=A0A1T5BZU6_9SPHI|nr:FAD-binding and (Fe-S)-binding domain-containing protein [Daejeonella lutea]SKB52579.1 D-lactate dehydrogenase [Daejeonella lutea]
MDIGKLLENILPKERIKCRLVDLVAYASDAGFYYLRPKAVVRPVNEDEIIAILQFSHEHKVPVTFRTGGTSLSGQSITDGILVDLKQYWNQIEIEDSGNRVRVQPGITGTMVNVFLKKHKRKIGPDPSSIDSAMIGGILSNNSSGMCCGVSMNSYHTTKHVRFILPNGKSFSTEIKDDYVRFEQECPEIYSSIQSLSQQISENPVLAERIRTKYLTKNTVGYSLNSFIDYSHPLDIFSHLLIGAEGTLGFIAEAVMETVPDYPYKSTAFIYFQDIYSACQAIKPLTDTGAEAVELMDRASLRSIENIKGVPSILKSLPEPTAALLVEYQANTVEELDTKIESLSPHSKEFLLLQPIVFTRDTVEQALYWKLRKGMFPAVGAVRASGTTVILEDIAFPVEQLGDAILDLHVLFAKYNYDNAIIFGHAKDGNIHFVVTQSFNSASEVDRYDRFLQEVVDLVVNKYDGTLKAEHGTGRNMSPFVETEWGSEAYQIMKQLKAVIDPENLLNPGVIINEHKDAHILDLKSLPTVEEEVDRCIECGYCEHKCPSRNITTTPRQRIVIRRELALLKSKGDMVTHKHLSSQYQYDGLDTCAVDGLCATSCPVDINTGDLIKRLRRENHSDFANNTALWISRNFKTVTAVVNFALSSGEVINKLFGKNAMVGVTKTIKKIIPPFPLWSNQLHTTGRIKGKYSTRIVEYTTEQSAVVYFPTCISRVMGGADNKKSIPEAFLSVSHKSGIQVIIPEGIDALCCGQLFSSKGFNMAYASKCNETVEKLWHITNEGRIPVVLDVTSCSQTLQKSRPILDELNKQRFDQLTIIDSIDYLHDHVIPAVNVVEKKGSIVLHPVCSLQKMGLERKFLAVANHFTEFVHIPVNAGCCGMAGDRGFLFPELTAAATAPEAGDVKLKQYDGYYSSGKTCEIAMSEAVGKNYESVLYLADECLK